MYSSKIRRGAFIRFCSFSAKVRSIQGPIRMLSSARQLPARLIRHRSRPSTLCACNDISFYRCSSTTSTSKGTAARRKTPSSRIRSRPSSTTSGALPFSATAAAAASSSSTTAPKPNRNILPLHLVESARVKFALPFIGNTAYVALASGFLMTDMLTLRCALVGGYTGLVAFHLLHPRPLRIPLKWSAFFVAVNAGAACFLIADQWGGSLTEEEEDLYNEHFPMLTRGQFQQLLSLSTTQPMADGTKLTVEGEHCEKIYFMKRGHSKLYVRNNHFANIDEGSFVNDVAFARHDGAEAYGTVVTDGDAEVIVWDWQALREYLKSRPDMDRNMRFCFTQHLVKGLMQQREAAHLKHLKTGEEDWTAVAGGEGGITIASVGADVQD